MRTKPVGYGVLILMLSFLTACIPFGKTIGGSITGLTGSGLVLQNNGGDNLAVTAGSTKFSFIKTIVRGGSYAVTVLTQPQNLTCTVSNGSGTVADVNISNVAINCVANTPAPVPSFAVGGGITGLTGSGLVLQNNATDDLAVAAGSTQFLFANSISNGTSYAVTVLTQPQNQTCTVSSGSGTVGSANASNVAINCVVNPPAPVLSFSVGGGIAGLTGSGLILQNNAADNLAVAAGSTGISFATPIASGANYAVTVLTQPQSQTCTVNNGSGTMGNANVGNVLVSCVASAPAHFLYLQGVIKNGTTDNVSTLDTIPIDTGTGALGQGNVSSLGHLYLSGNSTSGNVYTFYIPPLGNFAYRSNLYVPTMGGIPGIQWSIFSRDPTTGALAAVTGGSIASVFGNFYGNLVFHPSGKFALDAASTSGIASYTVNTSSGALTIVAGGPLAASACTPSGPSPLPGFIFHPSGKFAYSLDVSSNKDCTALYHGISAYSIDLATGALGVVAGSPFFPQGMKSPGAISIHPSGKFAYVFDRGTYDATTKTYNTAESGLYLFGIDPVTGVLSASGSKLPLSGTISSLNFEPSGRFAYMYLSSTSADTVAAYAVDFNTGALTEVAGSPFAPSNPFALPIGTGGEFMFDPTGKYVYARGYGGGVRAYAIDASSGALAEIPGSTVQTPTPLNMPNYIR
jgi:hypothetical protein